MKHTLSVTGDVTSIKFKGSIDDQTEDYLAKLEPSLATKHIVIDCEEIDRINSIGAAAWSKWFDHMTVAHTVKLQNIHSVMVDFCNMLPNFCGQATIESLYAPFFCKKCKKDLEILFQVADLTPTKDWPETLCPKCQSVMVGIVDSADHLGFL